MMPDLLDIKMKKIVEMEKRLFDSFCWKEISMKIKMDAF